MDNTTKKKFNKFDLDLKFGKCFEHVVKDIVSKQKVEVKTERNKWVKTGNIVVEYESYGKPSGISVTEADYWWHNLTIDGNLFCSIVIPTAVLKKYVEKYKYIPKFKTYAFRVNMFHQQHPMNLPCCK